MYKKIVLSSLSISTLFASEVLLPQVNIESTQITQVAQNAQTSTDVADALSKSIPSIDMSRRSSIANDIFIRGQKRDNISVDIDGTKIYGAGPNRMDPPISHILANQIESIEVIEGPYDVENFGTLSGGVKIKTKKPSKKTTGSLNTGFGSFRYKKFGATLSGGNDRVRALLTSSIESSDQYRDGNGDTLVQQTKNRAPKSNQYKTEYGNLVAFNKKSFNTKIYFKLSKNQELKLSYTKNKSTNLLYPNGAMDSASDDANIYSISYNIKDFHAQYYHSSVEHIMDNHYRNSSNMSAMDMTNSLKSKMQGIKLKNIFNFSDYKILLGLDTSKRDWSGEYLNTTTKLYKADSISDTQTFNKAVFVKIDKSYKKFKTSVAMRYDSTKITNQKFQDNDYSALNANIISTYNISDNNKVFLGIGKASRVPDARELYFLSKGKLVGTPTLNQTTNSEIDFGYEIKNYDFKLKIKLFYSMLKDYIYIKKGSTTNAFYNINANIYGGELSTSYYINDEISLDAIASYKRGTKERALVNQTNKNLADMAPLRGNISLNYEYKKDSKASIELQASDKWENIDNDNGEQKLSAWGIVNMKLKHAVNKKFDFTLGVNNLLNKTYVTSNTYADLSLIITGSNKAMLLNESGRYIYTNLDFKF